MLDEVSRIVNRGHNTEQDVHPITQRDIDEKYYILAGRDETMLTRVIRYPVKSMLGEELTDTVLTERGIEGDRGWALIDQTTGRVVSAKYPRQWQHMLRLSAHHAEAGDGRVAITLPDGRKICSDDDGVDQVLSAFFGRAVHLSREVPKEATIARVDPLVDGEPVSEVDRVVTTSVLGRGALPGTFFDYAPLHVVTTATLNRLQELTPRSCFDVARFRPNLVLDLPASEAFAENVWAGAMLCIGREVVLRLGKPTPRCAVPTLAQPGLPQDSAIITTIAHRNQIVVDGGRRVACVGSYAYVVRGGMIHVGDTVALAPPDFSIVPGVD